MLMVAFTPAFSQAADLTVSRALIAGFAVLMTRLTDVMAP